MVNWKFWKKEEVAPIEYKRPDVAGCGGCVNEEEARITKQWSEARSYYEMLSMANTANLKPIERAKLSMDLTIAQTRFSKADKEMREYVEKTYG